MAKDMTKEKIINTAYNLFIEKGYDNVTINDICRTCGITKTTFYYHLRSKEDIISHFYDSITPSLGSRILDVVSAENYWEQLMVCFETIILSSQYIGSDLNGQLLIMNIKDDKGTYDFTEDLTPIAVTIIKKAQKAGQIRNQSPAEQLYRASAYAFMGYETIWCIKKGSFDRLKHVRYAMENIYDVDPSLRRDNSDKNI